MIPEEKKNKTKQKANAYDPIWAVPRCEWKPRAKPQHGCSQHGSRGPAADLRTVPQPCPPRPTNYFSMLHWALFLFFPFHEAALLLFFPWSVPLFLALKALCKLQGRPIAMSSGSSTVQIPCGHRAALAGAALLTSAELQDLWLNTIHTYQKKKQKTKQTSAISHVY